MLHAAIGGVILSAVYRRMDSGSDCEIDTWSAAAVILAAWLLIIILNVCLAFIGLTGNFFVALSLYFLVPFLVFKSALEFPAAAAVKFALVVPVVVVVSEFLSGLFFSLAMMLISWVLG